MSDVYWCRKFQYPTLMEIDKKASIRPWPIDEWKTYFAEEYDYILAEEQNTPVGFAVVHKVMDDWHISNIAILPTVQRQGFGWMILQFIEAEARQAQVLQLHLEVRQKNTAAQKLYEKAGYHLISTRKKYYREPTDDAFVYLKQLCLNSDVY